MFTVNYRTTMGIGESGWRRTERTEREWEGGCGCGVGEEEEVGREEGGG